MRELLEKCGLFVSCASDFTREERINLLQEIKVELAKPEPPAQQKPLTDQERQRLETLERVCEGLRQDTIDGGFNFKDFGKYARDLEEKNKAMTAKLQRV